MPQAVLMAKYEVLEICHKLS